MTGEEAACFLGISRSTLYRWVELWRLPRVWTEETLAPYLGLAYRPKGPPRDRSSRRYTVYRHRFDEKRGKRV